MEELLLLVIVPCCVWLGLVETGLSESTFSPSVIFTGNIKSKIARKLSQQDVTYANNFRNVPHRHLPLMFWFCQLLAQKPVLFLILFSKLLQFCKQKTNKTKNICLLMLQKIIII